ncbi:MAG TPA: hypothetical protein VJV77_13095 [Casimicrobiaceae bacterium]|nr:hypothetical protein [Casimicrobiaceae bacterium]
MSRPLLPAIMLAVLPLAASAQGLIEWKGDARYEKTHTIAPGKFAELCTKLSAGSEVQWSFAADAPLDFNIHYHAGNRVEYPAKADGSRRESGVLVVPQAQDYCWMWTNRGATPSGVKVTLDRPR